MQAKNTVFFYTNNFISEKILKLTLDAVINQCRENDSELIITSHYPLLEKHEEVFGFDTVDEFKNQQLDTNLVTDYVLDIEEDFVRNYVFGRLPYKIESILHQLIFSCQKCNTKNAILFEHDCLYPDNYIQIVGDNLDNFDMTYCMEGYWMANHDGFYDCEPHVFLSSFSAKTEIFLRVFEHKLKVGGIEPTVPYDLVLVDLPNATGAVKKAIKPRTKETAHLPKHQDNVDSNKGDLVIENSKCLDDCFGDECILEFQHGLNTSSSLARMRDVAAQEGNERYTVGHQDHPYWGSFGKYSSLFNEIEESDIGRQIFYRGLRGVCEDL